MSHIDTISHSHIGYLANYLPVYHPLESDKEYGFDEKSIVIGGGSGEHEIFFIKNMNDCLQYYAFMMDDDDDSYEEYPYSEFKSFWSISENYYFYKEIKKELKSFKKYRNFNLCAEDYIQMAVGEFLALCGRHFVDQGLIENEVFEKAKKVAEQNDYLGYIVQYPIGYKTNGIILRNGKCEWGYSFEQEKSDYWLNKNEQIIKNNKNANVVELKSSKNKTVEYLEIKVSPKSWSETLFNNMPDEKGDIPFKQAEEWNAKIEIKTGRVLDWPSGNVAKIRYKVGKTGHYYLLDKDMNPMLIWYGDRVPEAVCLENPKTLEYVALNIGKDGMIDDWSELQALIGDWGKI